MKASPIKINIPKPCSENWNQMVAREDGRFCESCNQCVRDFTRFTDQQLFDYFSTAKAETCGRFSSYQLDRIIVNQEYASRRRFLPQILFGALLTFAFDSYATAKAKLFSGVQIENMQKEILGDEEKKKGVKGDGPLFIKGIVLDEYGDGIPGATIVVIDTHDSLKTDFDGYFKFSIPEKHSQQSISIAVSYPGYITSLQKFIPKKLPKNFEVKLKLKENVGEVVPFFMGKVPLIEQKKK